MLNKTKVLQISLPFPFSQNLNIFLKILTLKFILRMKQFDRKQHFLFITISLTKPKKWSEIKKKQQELFNMPSDFHIYSDLKADLQLLINASKTTKRKTLNT